MKKILFVGSSIFEGWKNAIDLIPDCIAANRAVGGTKTADWVRLLPDIIVSETPDAILYYCGSNDLSYDIPKERILDNVRDFRMIMCKKAPFARLAYFGIIKSPQKTGKWDVIDTLNKNISSMLQEGDLYLDPNEVFFHAGAPVARFYIEDGLHMTDEAYLRLSDYAAPIINGWLNEEE
ncbi:MAG: GDSL-type esterase/lipase family protein [Victivallales bacterium]|jgi:lysophospholipase L1-like esterase